MLRAAAVRTVLIAAAFAFTGLVGRAFAQQDEAVAFARKVVAAVKADAVRLEATVKPQAGLDRLAADRDALMAALQESLRRSGKRVDTISAARLQLTFTAQNGEALWVAQIVEGGQQQVLMFRPAEPEGEAESPVASPIALVLQPVFEQEGRILDLAVDGASMLVLERWRIVRYEGQPGEWKRASAGPIELIPAPGTLPIRPTREARARLLATAGTYAVDAQRMRCGGPGSTAASLPCRPTDLAKDEPALPSVALWETGGQPRRALAIAPGTVAVQDASGAEMLRIEGYGDEVAALESSCGDMLLLLSSPGDATQPEWLRAVSVDGGRARERSTSMELPGRMTALWPTSAPNRVLAIVHEEARNRYVAFHVLAVCGK